MTPVPSSPLLTRNPNLVAADIDGDLVMMSVEQGEYFGITGVGSRVWKLLATPTTVADITRVICAEYAVEEAQCQADMQGFVEELIQLGLVSAA
ncbi:MAG: PqqD family protein [Candidatus Competibacteraceae bacterium]|nr:MAG: PqqD family protein [Candidatus Competibacteraceae bacterium]